VIAFRKPYIAEVLIDARVYQFLAYVIGNMTAKKPEYFMNFSRHWPTFSEKQGLLST